MTTRGEVNGSRKISRETFGRCPKSPPNTHKKTTVISTTQVSEWMFPKNTAGHYRAIRARAHTELRNRKYDTQLLLRRSGFPNLKYPSQRVIRVLRQMPRNGRKPTQKLELESETKCANHRQNARAGNSGWKFEQLELEIGPAILTENRDTEAGTGHATASSGRCTARRPDGVHRTLRCPTETETREKENAGGGAAHREQERSALEPGGARDLYLLGAACRCAAFLKREQEA